MTKIQQLLRSCTLVDIEADGLDPNRNRILQFAWHRIRDGVKVDGGSIWINPRMSQSPDIAKGVSKADPDWMQRNAEMAERYGAPLRPFANYWFTSYPKPIVSYGMFDHNISVAECARERVGKPTREWWDALSIIKAMGLGWDTYKLEYVRHDLPQHDADHDCTRLLHQMHRANGHSRKKGV